MHSMLHVIDSKIMNFLMRHYNLSGYRWKLKYSSQMNHIKFIIFSCLSLSSNVLLSFAMALTPYGQHIVCCGLSIRQWDFRFISEVTERLIVYFCRLSSTLVLLPNAELMRITYFFVNLQSKDSFFSIVISQRVSISYTFIPKDVCILSETYSMVVFFIHLVIKKKL